jgi:hypothetical protein
LLAESLINIKEIRAIAAILTGETTPTQMQMKEIIKSRNYQGMETGYGPDMSAKWRFSSRQI